MGFEFLRKQRSRQHRRSGPRRAWRMRSPGARQPSRFLAAVGLLLMAVFVAPGAHASDETSRLRAVVEVGVSQGTVLGSPWAPRTSYRVSLLGLWEAGQGVGARLSWLPPATPAEAWELSTDAVARFTGEGPLYFKALGGVAVTPSPWWPPRLRAGGEVGVHAIRGSIGLEVGLGGVYSFPPSQLSQGEGVLSLGVGILFGFGTPSRTPALAPPQRQWAQQSAQSPQGALPPRGLGPSSAAEARTAGLAPAASEVALTPFGERDVIQQILLLQKPAAVQSWWNEGPWEDIAHWSHPLSEWERKYAEAMSAATVPEAIRMWPLVTPERLTPEQREDMERRLGTGAAAEGYAHWENRRRIVKHYFMTHPATLQQLLGLYGLARDVNPLHFALERGWQMGSGQEMFTEQKVSQLGAAQEFFTALAVGVAAGKLMTATRPVPGWGVPEPVEPVGPGGWRLRPLRREPWHVLQNPLRRQHRPLRRRAPSRPHPNWSKPSRARTQRRRCPPASVCVRTSPSSRKCQTHSGRAVPSAQAPGRMLNSRRTSSTWRTCYTPRTFG